MDANVEQIQAPSLGARLKRVLQNRRLWLYVRVGLTITMLWLVVRQTDIPTMLKTLAATDARYMALVVALAFLDRFQMAYKWNMLLRVRGMGFSHLEAFRIYMGSAFVGTFLPAGVGADVVRGLRATIQGRAAGRVAATILIERILGLLALVTLALLGFVILSRAGETRFQPLYLATGALFVGMIVGLAVSVQPVAFDIIQRLLSRVKRFPLVSIYLELHQAYVDFGRQRTALIWFFLLSVAEHATLSVLTYYGARALDLNVDLVYFLALIPITVLIGTLPISINAIGVQEGLYVVLFGWAGLTPVEALSLSLLMRVTETVVLIPSGLIFLYDMARVRAVEGASAE